MIRTIVKIDEEKCVGCGLCAHACHEGAIGMVNGKAKLLRDDYCDGMGDCLPACPRGAISFEKREAAAYDESAVQANKRQKEKDKKVKPFSALFKKSEKSAPARATEIFVGKTAYSGNATTGINWPVQIKLAPTKAEYFDGADLLVAADCTAFTYGNFHNDFIQGHTVLVGCPKLDDVDYSEKLAMILRLNDVKSVSLVRMQVPCCGGLRFAVEKAIKASGKKFTLKTTVISVDGKIVG